MCYSCGVNVVGNSANGVVLVAVVGVVVVIVVAVWPKINDN